MNKYIWLIIVVAVIVAGGVGYKVFMGGGSNCPPTGETKEITVTAIKDEWAFEPEVIDVNCGDKVVLKVVNEDSYDHGIAIEQFGVSQRMPADSVITLDFIAVKPGEFQFICSVPCGEGEVHGGKYDGKHRGHFDMIGTIKVKDIIKTSTPDKPQQPTFEALFDSYVQAETAGDVAAFNALISQKILTAQKEALQKMGVASLTPELLKESAKKFADSKFFTVKSFEYVSDTTARLTYEGNIPKTSATEARTAVRTVNFVKEGSGWKIDSVLTDYKTATPGNTNFRAATNCPPTGETKKITVTALKDQWMFSPNFIEVNCGDKVALRAVNKNSYDHGISIAQFGVSQRIPANSEITVDFIASNPGEFDFICSVPCGEGEVNGEHRSHFDMTGKIKVNSAQSP